MEDFAFDFLTLLYQRYEDFVAHMCQVWEKLWPMIVKVFFVTIEVIRERAWEIWCVTWYDDYPGIPFFEGVLTDLFNTYVLDPLSDIDFAAMTDCEDLIAFAWDLFEFSEQDKSQLIDSATYAKWSDKVGIVLFGCIQLANRYMKKK